MLDIGTGSGVWAAEFATEHPAAEVIGIDKFSANHNCRPKQLPFLIQDAEQELQVGDAKFDVIHTRLVPFHAKEVPHVFRRCYTHLRPGGYIEMQEI